MNDFIKSKLFKQILKFAVVGGTSFLIDYFIMIFLKEVCHANYLIASVIGFTISVIYNYIMSAKWVFDMDDTKSKKETFAIFVVLSVIGLGINTALMWLFVDGTHLMPYFIAKLFATAVVMVYNFITRKLILEKK